MRQKKLLNAICCNVARIIYPEGYNETKDNPTKPKKEKLFYSSKTTNK